MATLETGAGTPSSTDKPINSATQPAGARSNTSARSTPNPRRSNRPNYALIHARKLPLDIYPLPPIQPHNPLSYLPYIYAIVCDFILPRSSHRRCPYQATFSPLTRSVHVTDPSTVRALWEAGFFGKGSLSRSEPNWLEAEKRRLGLVGRETAEEYSKARRKEREEFKRERARIEKELVEEVRGREAAGLSGLASGEGSDQIPVIAGTRAKAIMEQRAAERNQAPSRLLIEIPLSEDASNPVDEVDIVNQEHLQLALEESFFLTYALGSLSISTPNQQPSIKDAWDLLTLFRRHSYFPPLSPTSPLNPDDPFLLSYVVYHHFRSLGWVVRPGLKFSVDYLLYERGVVFSHATFAILIIPSYNDAYWFETKERREKVESERKRRSWYWFHAMNRVQNQVLKTLVLCYVDVPGVERQRTCVEARDVGALLKTYKVREFCAKRWSANRNRE